MRSSLWALCLLGLCGCVSTYGSINRGLLESRLHHDSEKVIDKDVEKIQTLKPQIRFPCRVAVAVRADGRGEWRWSPKDRQAMHSWGESLRKEGIASEVVFMSKMFTCGDDLKGLRASAAKYGADALLVIAGSAATDSRLNALAILNATVVGGFVVPASHRDALFQIEGGFVDVNNGYLYAAVEAEGEGSTLAPTFVIEEKDAIEKAKLEALAAFGPALLAQLHSLKSIAVAAGPVPAPKP